MSVAPAPTPRKKISLLIVQLGEWEEIYRSLMALKAIKHLYPEVNIHFLTRHEVAAPLRKIDWITAIYETPILKTPHESMPKVAQWINQVIHLQYDLLVNWTYAKKFSRMSAVVTSLIPAFIKLGEYVRNDFTSGSYDAWSMYQSAWLKNSIEQDIHHTDIITTQLLTALQIHVGDPDSGAGASAVSSRYFFKNSTIEISPEWIGRPKNLKWVALDGDSLGASGFLFLERLNTRHPDYGVVIFGNLKSDIDFTVFSDPSRIIFLSGELSFEQQVHVLSACQWVVAGRSPIVDLASLMNLRVLYLVPQVSFRSLKWMETGPYGNQHGVIQSEDAISADTVYGAWSYWSSEWFHKGSMKMETHFENLEMSEALADIQVFKSRIRAPDEGGGVCYEPQIAKGYCFEAWMVRLRGQIARAWFCGWLPGIDSEIAKIKLNPELIGRVRGIQASVEVLERLAREGKMISNELAAHAEGMHSNFVMTLEDRERIESYGKKLLEVEALISRVIQVEPELIGILKWYQQMMSNLQGETMVAMAKETASVFDLVSEGVELISSYAQKTLSLAKPKAVAAQGVLQGVAEGSSEI